MPRVQPEVPEKLRPYLFHGVDLTWRGSEATGDCPFCGREGKFSVSLETGKCKCWVCSAETQEKGGNAYVFLRRLHEMSYEATRDYSGLAEDRGVDETALIQWQAATSITTGDWLLPGYNASGNMVQLYRYVDNGRRRLLMPTPTLGHGIHGMNLYQDNRDVVYLCEGPWDGIALWDALRQAKEDDEGNLTRTSNPDRSLLAEANVLAIPGLTTYKDAWNPLLAGKKVCLMFDNDHPRPHPKTGKIGEPEAHRMTLRLAEQLMRSKDHPEGVLHYRWGEQGYDPDLPSGYDVRDLLNA